MFYLPYPNKRIKFVRYRYYFLFIYALQRLASTCRTDHSMSNFNVTQTFSLLLSTLTLPGCLENFTLVLLLSDMEIRKLN